MSDEYIDETKTGVTAQPEIDSIWLTRPSFKPVLLAVALLGTMIGLFAFRPLMWIMLVAVLWITGAWISESRSDSDDLPIT